jgi:hypothetical protein
VRAVGRVGRVGVERADLLPINMKITKGSSRRQRLSPSQSKQSKISVNQSINSNQSFNMGLSQQQHFFPNALSKATNKKRQTPNKKVKASCIFLSNAQSKATFP